MSKMCKFHTIVAKPIRYVIIILICALAEYAPCEVFVMFFVLSFWVYCIIFRVPWCDLHNK